MSKVFASAFPSLNQSMTSRLIVPGVATITEPSEMATTLAPTSCIGGASFGGRTAWKQARKLKKVRRVTPATTTVRIRRGMTAPFRNPYPLDRAPGELAPVSKLERAGGERIKSYKRG